MFERLSTPERIAIAKDKVSRVVDHLLYVLELHENNAIILYSHTLSSQIPESYAANAFNVFQRGMHQFEIVRLCALWDRAELTRENIPTVIELIDHPDVIDSLVQETAAYWHDLDSSLTNPPEDQELRALAEQALKSSNQQFGKEQSELARSELRKAISDSRALTASPKLSSIVNLRDKHLAHSLSETHRERKAGPLAPMKYGDERDILNSTLPIVESLYCWINGKSFSFEQSRRIDRKNAEALWQSCTFNIIR